MLAALIAFIMGAYGALGWSLARRADRIIKRLDAVLRQDRP